MAVRLLKRSVVGVAFLVALPYAWGPVYRFPQPTLFTGAHLYNPYGPYRPPAPSGSSASVDAPGVAGAEIWQRANLHAHGRAWVGLTNGEQPDEAVVARYHDLGYSVAGISDYHRIAAQHGIATIPVYEHGYNIGKHHQLAIGAREVEWFDFLLWQSTSHEQYVIDRVGRTAELVAINHPTLRDAYSIEDMQQLTGYQLMEVVNGPFTADDVWDAALSTGHAVWALANDDTHDINDPGRTAVAWNMIGAPTPGTGDVIAALRAGRTYAVLRTSDAPVAMDARLAAVDVRDGRVRVTTTGVPATFVFVGQGGDVRKTVAEVHEADYALQPADTYIRTVIRTPNTTLFLNPVLRYDGAALPAPAAAVDVAGTWLSRGTWTMAGLALVLLWRKRRAPSLARATRSVVPDADQNPA